MCDLGRGFLLWERREYCTIISMTSQKMTKLKLPDSPGVYIFRDAQGRPLYIGRATSLRDRTRSYFAADLIETRGPRIVDMVTRAHTVTYEETGSVLEAVIREAALIRQYQPRYNVDERDDKSDQYVIVTEEEWPRVFLVRARDYDHARKEGQLEYKVRQTFGPYPQAGVIKEALRILRRLFPFRDKKSLDPRHDRFYRAIGRSPDIGASGSREGYVETIERLVLFFQGKKGQLQKQLRSDMSKAAEELRFEDADRAKKLLYALDHINDIALVKKERDPIRGKASAWKIEAYDVAHLAGTNVVGVMVASVGGEFVKSEYRKFKISRQTNDDIGALREILMRRLRHSEWAYPDLVVVDGNEVHVAAAEGILKALRLSIAVVGVTKDVRHKAARLIGDPLIVRAYKESIIALNAEAHRFAISFHRQRRSVIR